MTKSNLAERILFCDLVNRAWGHSFALITVSDKKFNDTENQFRHRSLVGKIKKKAYEVFDFRASTANPDGSISETVSLHAFVIDNGTDWNQFTALMRNLVDAFSGGWTACVPATIAVTCAEDIGEFHRVYLSRKSDTGSDHVEYPKMDSEPARLGGIGDECAIGPKLFIEGKIREWPRKYTSLRNESGYDARDHWRLMYEHAEKNNVRRTACEEIALETEFHDGALIGVGGRDIHQDSALRKDISLRAFLRCHRATWRCKILRSHYLSREGDKIPCKLWYVCDWEDSGRLLPLLYDRALFLGLEYFYWISANGSVDKILVREELPAGLSANEALNMLDTRSCRQRKSSHTSDSRREAIPQRLEEWILGNRFEYDIRPEIHGIAENQWRYLADKQLAALDWKSIEVTEETRYSTSGW